MERTNNQTASRVEEVESHLYHVASGRITASSLRKMYDDPHFFEENVGHFVARIPKLQGTAMDILSMSGTTVSIAYNVEDDGKDNGMLAIYGRPSDAQETVSLLESILNIKLERRM